MYIYLVSKVTLLGGGSQTKCSIDSSKTETHACGFRVIFSQVPLALKVSMCQREQTRQQQKYRLSYHLTSRPVVSNCTGGKERFNSSAPKYNAAHGRFVRGKHGDKLRPINISPLTLTVLG